VHDRQYVDRRPHRELRQVPTLSEWAMILLAALMAMAAFLAMRRRTK
jgi:hypothetical protein